jgi:hypothetical protein
MNSPEFLLRAPQDHVGPGFEEPIAIFTGMVHIDTMGVVFNYSDLESFFTERPDHLFD